MWECVQACKNGSIHIKNYEKNLPHSEIVKETYISCSFCFRVYPTNAFKYGQLLPKIIKGGKAIAVNQDKCINCITCTRACLSIGSINVGRINKLPYINPGYFSRYEKYLYPCPLTAGINFYFMARTSFFCFCFENNSFKHIFLVYMDFFE